MTNVFAIKLVTFVKFEPSFCNNCAFLLYNCDLKSQLFQIRPLLLMGK